MFQILGELYFDTIRDLYSAETQLLDALPEIAFQAKNPELREAFHCHFDEIQDKVERVRTICQRHGFACGGATCETMRFLIRDVKSHISKMEGSEDMRDAGLTALTLRIDHYELALWGLAQSFADCLGLDDDSDLLDEFCDQEGTVTHIITKIAAGAPVISSLEKTASEGSQPAITGRLPRQSGAGVLLSSRSSTPGPFPGGWYSARTMGHRIHHGANARSTVQTATVSGPLCGTRVTR
jgi:ferritin-like metal-binding protein YciE